MEAGALNGRAGVSPAMECARDLGAAWFEPFRPWIGRSDPRPAGRLDLALLNRFAVARGVRTEDGLPLRFVEARQTSAAAYEGSIGESGAVPTRTHGPGMLHDWFNALAWLAFPCVKARLNRLHRDALAVNAGRAAGNMSGSGAGDDSVAAHGLGTAGERDVAGLRPAGRGALRDAATLLDENGVLFVCRDPAMVASLRNRDWLALFVDGRERFATGVSVRVLGHGLCEKLLVPYKAMCAHAWIVELPVDATADPDREALDAMVVARLRPDTLRAAHLQPLPLLGVPGWWPANADPAFYDDPAVFRRARRAG